MPDSEVEVVIIGGGAAGGGAARRLHDASVPCLLVEARPRLGGRAWTVTGSGFPLDVGCGWLHSADRNPWVGIAEKLGATIDKTPPAWSREPLAIGFPHAEQADYRRAQDEFQARLERAAAHGPDIAAASLLDPACRWNGLLNAVSTYISGAELDRISVKDLERYDATDINWRVVEGYGTVVSAHGASVPAMLDCPVGAIDHGGKRLRIETARGAITADRVIVTLPSTILATERVRFSPALPQKVDAAVGLPLGLADKQFIALERADEFKKDVRLFARTDRPATAGYNIRPFGRPLIEAYFGGSLAAELEANGGPAFFEFAVSELVGVFGSDFARRLKPLDIHHWGHDPFALGSYSYAVPGAADCRLTLAEPVDDRVFFAGEACSEHDFSTAHGAFLTGIAAADRVIAARRRPARQLTQNIAR